MELVCQSSSCFVEPSCGQPNRSTPWRWTDGTHWPTKYLSKDRVVYWSKNLMNL